MRALVLLLLCLPAFAQHHPEKVTGVKKDPNRGGLPVLVAPRPGESEAHAMDHAVQAGNGAPGSSQHGAWLVAPTTGAYVFPQFSTTLNKKGERRPVFMAQYTHGPVSLIAGRVYRLWPWNGPLVWIRPDGVQEKVPPQYLIEVSPANVGKSRK
jgi:hypothetical protein